MLILSESNIHLNQTASNKQQAIEMAAHALEQSGFVASGYVNGMLARETQTSTFLGNGIAIPHGTLDTRELVQKTGVQVFQFPQGVDWGEGNIAYVVIGIAAKSDEHLALLRQLTHVLGDEETAEQLAKIGDAAQFAALLQGKKTQQAFQLQAEMLTLEIDSQSLLALTAINAGKLEQAGFVNHAFVAEAISNAALPLGKGLWLTDSVSGNVKNGLAFARPKAAFDCNGKTIAGVLTISAVDTQIHATLARLLQEDVQNALLNADSPGILAALNGEKTAQDSAEMRVIGTFTIRNEHGLHARPSAVLVNEAKKFNAKIQVQNLTRGSESVSAKSLMKIVALGATQNHRLRFEAIGEDAKAAIEAIGAVIAAGLGESVSSVPPQEADSIEVLGGNQTVLVAPSASQDESLPNDALEAVFVIQNEHGLHARPSAVLVNEVKKYQAAIAVQNLDRDSALVNAKSLMKVVALGVTKGHRLRFVATGEQAQQALDGIGAAIAAGLGENAQ